MASGRIKPWNWLYITPSADYQNRKIPTDSADEARFLRERVRRNQLGAFRPMKTIVTTALIALMGTGAALADDAVNFSNGAVGVNVPILLQGAFEPLKRQAAFRNFSR